LECGALVHFAHHPSLRTLNIRTWQLNIAMEQCVHELRSKGITVRVSALSDHALDQTEKTGDLFGTHVLA
jgi:hypothetical protein